MEREFQLNQPSQTWEHSHPGQAGLRQPSHPVLAAPETDHGRRRAEDTRKV
jgi:hypothetical protein